ncbi:MAG: glycosyltransferase family 2 protein [Thermodesulfobacteriota bacterium]|nr:glycosyltransferase family 2 protein [Thermodesulfobacteriota bacterium]
MNAPKKNSNVLTLIVPSYNEASVLPKLLPDLIAYCEDKKWKIILVNDGSTDETSSILNNYPNTDNFKVIHHRLNRGYGAAIKSGISEADTKYIVTIDSDGQHYLEETNKRLKSSSFLTCQEKNLLPGWTLIQ